METDELNGVDASRLDSGYDGQDELLRDLMAWLDLHLYYYYTHHRWLGPSSEMKNLLGLVVTREEFEHNLTKAAQRGLPTMLNEDEREQIELATAAVRLRLERTDATISLRELFSRFELDEFERSCVVMAYAPEIDLKYTKLFAYLQDDMTRKAPGVSLCCELFLPKGMELAACMSRFHGGGFVRLFDRQELDKGLLVLRSEVVEFLANGTLRDSGAFRLFDGGARERLDPLSIQENVARQLDAAFTYHERCCVRLSGPSGGGKRFQIEHLMARQRARCVFADLEGDDWREAAQRASLAADLTDSYLCLYHLDRKDETGQSVPPPQSMLEELERLELRRDKRFFLSRLASPMRLRTLTVELELPQANETDRLTLFESALRDARLTGCTTEELASKFRFSPRQIRVACEQATGLARLNGENEVSSELIHRCCYRQSVHRLGELATQVTAGYTWDDVVLPDSQKNLMRRACGHIRYRHQVSARWGFDRKVGYGWGLSILFAGSPGTGKTMCAQVIAHELNMELYKINLSQIVSKYIGETEKNLRALFTEAKNASCILFFDECDALFGKRSEVKDSHDRNANVEVAYLLQQIEEYDGVCILATNLMGNIDAAFMRRITYVVYFPFPEPPAREAIYRGMLPADAPVSEDIDWQFLAEKFELSGGHIKNIVLSAAFMAAGEGAPISMRHLLRAAVTELKKNEIVVVREQLREYADLLDDPQGEA
ncbi:MAG: ATP-binding protein [Ruminococcaceae bacterium]|nr:ATP-binding protein [Oscillospiraceae bacterium]